MEIIYENTVIIITIKNNNRWGACMYSIYRVERSLKIDYKIYEVVENTTWY